jgi:hypothetical protein
MELNKIEPLLEKYFDGLTSIAEEKELTNYFSSSNVAQHLLQYQSIFGYYNHAKREKFVKIVPLIPNSRDAKIKVAWLSIAASFTILLGAAMFMYTNSLDKENSDLGTFDNPETALIETQKQLNLISENINMGYKSVAVINEYQQSKNLIFKQ